MKHQRITPQVFAGETWCGEMSCGHPACWTACRRIKRGTQNPSINSDDQQSYSSLDGLEIKIPTQKVVNLNQDLLSQQNNSLSVELFSTGPNSRALSLLEYVHSRHKAPIPPNTPNSSPTQVKSYKKFTTSRDLTTLSSSSDQLAGAVLPEPHVTIQQQHQQHVPVIPKVKQLMVQELFESEYSRNNFKEPVIQRPYYTWVPKPKVTSGAPQQTSTNKRLENFRPPLSSSSPFVCLAPVPSFDIGEPVQHQVSEPESPLLDKRKKSSDAVRAIKAKRVLTKSESVSGPTAFNIQKLQSDNFVRLLGLPPDVLSHVLDGIESGAPFNRDNLENLVKSYAQSDNPSSGLQGRNLSSSLLQKKAPIYHSKSKVLDLKATPLHQKLSDDQDSPVSNTSLPNISSGRREIQSAVKESRLQNTRQSSTNQRNPTQPVVNFINFDFQTLGSGNRRLSLYKEFEPLPYSGVSRLLRSASSTSRSSPRTTSDSASMNVTVSTDRSTVCTDVFPPTFVPDKAMLYSEPAKTTIPLIGNENDPHELMPKMMSSMESHDTYITYLPRNGAIKIVNIPERRASRMSQSAPSIPLNDMYPFPPPPSPIRNDANTPVHIPTADEEDELRLIINSSNNNKNVFIRPH